jgi:S1-C subfamily serine protease
MRIENSPGSYGFLAGLMVLLLAAFANAGCMREARGREAAVAFESTVLIDIMCVDEQGGGYTSNGSGVIVNDSTIFTAAHVATDPDGYVCMRRATMVNGKSYPLAPGVVRKDRDLASLKLILQKFDPTWPVVFGVAPAFGTTVCAMTAYPRWLWKCGEVQTREQPPGDISVTIVVEGGNSGSGVYDTRGRLVGLVTHRWSCSNMQYCGGKMASLEGYVKELLGE